jgi:hypothetical protein
MGCGRGITCWGRLRNWQKTSVCPRLRGRWINSWPGDAGDCRSLRAEYAEPFGHATGLPRKPEGRPVANPRTEPACVGESLPVPARASPTPPLRRDLTHVTPESIMPPSSHRIIRLADDNSCPIPAEPTHYHTCRTWPEGKPFACADFHRLPDAGVNGETGQRIPPSRMGGRTEPRVRRAPSPDDEKPAPAPARKSPPAAPNHTPSPAATPGPDGERWCGCGAPLPKRRRCCDDCRRQRREETMSRRRTRKRLATLRCRATATLSEARRPTR